MRGYALYQGDKPIKIPLLNDQDYYVNCIVFTSKRDLKSSTDIEDDEEIWEVEIIKKFKRKR